jgi:hypothetical protein
MKKARAIADPASVFLGWGDERNPGLLKGNLS